MKTQYPLIVGKKIFNHGLTINLDPTGYFCLDKASFFIDDPNPFLYKWTSRFHSLVPQVDFILTSLFMCDALFCCHSCAFEAGDGSFFPFFPFFPGTSLIGSAGGISRKLFFAANLSAVNFS